VLARVGYNMLNVCRPRVAIVAFAAAFAGLSVSRHRSSSACDSCTTCLRCSWSKPWYAAAVCRCESVGSWVSTRRRDVNLRVQSTATGASASPALLATVSARKAEMEREYERMLGEETRRITRFETEKRARERKVCMCVPRLIRTYRSAPH
jgi:hypothetical protein